MFKISCPLTTPHRVLLLLLFLIAAPIVLAQKTTNDLITVKGQIVDNKTNQPVGEVFVSISEKNGVTNKKGEFNLSIHSNTKNKTLLIKHLSYQKLSMILDTLELINQTINLGVIKLTPKDKILDAVDIIGEDETDRQQAGLTKIKIKDAKSVTSTFGDFNDVLALQSGVVANNELSSTYSVRGGSFDENLVYVDNIEVYRPVLIKSGRQEGLSFVNPDLVDQIDFSSGGWQSKYGDKLSSMLSITYKNPTKNKASAMLGILGGRIAVEGISKNKRISSIIGIRHKSAQYLLNTLETKGEYKPKFTDIQAKINYNFKKRAKDHVSLFFARAQNNYLVIPSSRQSDFGTFNTALRLTVLFDGRERLDYITNQVSFVYEREEHNKSKNIFTASYLSTSEREYFDLENGYRLCDVDKDTNSNTFNNCAVTKGLGTSLDYGRNTLESDIIDIKFNHYSNPFNTHQISYGIAYNHRVIKDQIDQYSFEEKEDFITFTDKLFADQLLDATQIDGYIQDQMKIGKAGSLNLGVRAKYRGLTNEVLWSPRLQVSIKPRWKKDYIFNFSAGVYQQVPFYREMRYRENLKTGKTTQKSMHFILGMDHQLQIWNRPFRMISELWYKWLWDIIPYDQQNVRLRYLDKLASGYARGLDFRLHGEFIPGTNSWVSIGLLDTKEDVGGDGRGLIRRPTDQLVTFSIAFEDHIPKDPTIRVNLRAQIGSGLPFGPPNSAAGRARFKGPSYKRVDIGFYKYFNGKDGKKKTFGIFNEFNIGLQILNLLGAENTISYLWIKTFNNEQYAVPNALSQRFFNLQLSMSI